MQLRPFQIEALEALQEPGHILCIAPTGSGKSLIFERHALISKKRCLIISPLVALMRQQLEKFQSMGIHAQIGTRDPHASTWIISPEMLNYESHQKALRTWKPEFLVVDECHCLWDWGDGFRPSFLQIPALIHQLNIPQSLWLTATLSPAAKFELNQSLGIELTQIGAFDLPSRLTVHFKRSSWETRAEQFIQTLEESRGTPGIAFAPTREGARRLSRLARAAGHHNLLYHAGLSKEERTNGEMLITEQKTSLIIATSAFGLGMDFPQLRWVLLWQSPPSLIALAQTMGRVGRGIHSGKATVLWDDEDFKLLEWTLNGSPRRATELTQTKRALEHEGCRHQAIRLYFNGTAGASCHSRCDRCLFSLP